MIDSPLSAAASSRSRRRRGGVVGERVPGLACLHERRLLLDGRRFRPGRRRDAARGEESHQVDRRVDAGQHGAGRRRLESPPGSPPPRRARSASWSSTSSASSASCSWPRGATRPSAASRRTSQWHVVLAEGVEQQRLEPAVHQRTRSRDEDCPPVAGPLVAQASHLRRSWPQEIGRHDQGHNHADGQPGDDDRGPAARPHWQSRTPALATHPGAARRRDGAPGRSASVVFGIEADFLGIGADDGAPEDPGRQAVDLVAFERLERTHAELRDVSHVAQRAAGGFARRAQRQPEILTRFEHHHQLVVARPAAPDNVMLGPSIPAVNLADERRDGTPHGRTGRLPPVAAERRRSRPRRRRRCRPPTASPPAPGLRWRRPARGSRPRAPPARRVRAWDPPGAFDGRGRGRARNHGIHRTRRRTSSTVCTARDIQVPAAIQTAAGARRSTPA